MRLRLFFFFFITLLLIPTTFFAQQKRIYIAPDDHTDYMWTADEATYQQSFLTMIDYYLNQMDNTAGNPSQYQGRWNCDGSFWMWTFEKNRNQAQFNRFINRVRDGHMSVPLNSLVLVNGGTPAEAVLRGMYYPGLIERRHNVRFPMAASMENQVMPYGLGSLWAGSGARWSWKGVCGCATSVLNLGQRDKEIYWYGGPDGSRVLMKWHSLFDSQGIGGYAEARNPVNAINFVDTNTSFTSRYAYPVIGVFGKGWDDLETTTDEFITTAQNQTNANRQIIVSNQQDFFQDFETNHGASLSTVEASYGNEWELLVASMAEESARLKRSLTKLRSAEAMATLVSLQNPTFMNGRVNARDKAMLNYGLYFEHDWTADGPITRTARANWQRGLVNEIESYVNTLHTDAQTSLGGLIRKTGPNQRFYVFNSLSWSRTDYADFPYSNTNPIHVIDLGTGQETPTQIVTVDGQRRLRVFAQNVPSVGYKVFEIRQGAGNAFGNAATVAGSVIENAFYRVTVANNGAITSLIDKQRGNREFVRNINGRTINDLGAGTGTVEIENAGPVTVTLKITSSGPLAHTSRITFLRDSERIEIRNDITQNFGDVRTWSFSFDLNSPDTWHEEVGAVIRAKLTNAGGHYATRNARYDWLTLNHFADVTGSAGVGVTLSNADCYYMQLGNSTTLTLDTNTPQLNVLAGGQVDGPGLGIQNQGGASQFLQRFALTTHGAFDQVAAMKFSLEHQNQFTTGNITGGASYPETSYTLVNINNPNVLLWSVKPAEDGVSQGVVSRVWNLSNSSANFTLTLPFNVSGVKRTTHIETDIENISSTGTGFSNQIAQRQIRTYKLSVSSRGRSVFNDFDGDGKTDAAVFRPSNFFWYILQSQNDSMQYSQFGFASDKLVPADYDGDGKTDVAVWRPSDGVFYINQSGNGALRVVQWGLNGDIPVYGDFDGDGKADPTVWRPSNGVFYALKSSDNGAMIQQFGTNGDAPVGGDYDGDGKFDFAVWRPSNGTWYALRSVDGNFQTGQFGMMGDKPIAGDYDGDGKNDLAVFRPSNATWYVLKSSDNNFFAVRFGLNDDLMTPGDYDGDGKYDLSVWRPSNGFQYTMLSSNNSFRSLDWGMNGDAPTASAYLP